MLISQIVQKLYQAITDIVKMDSTSKEKIRDAKFYSDQGNKFLLEGDLDQALVSFNQAIELDPDFAEAYYNLGLLFHTQNDYNKATSQS